MPLGNWWPASHLRGSARGPCGRVPVSPRKWEARKGGLRATLEPVGKALPTAVKPPQLLTINASVCKAKVINKMVSKLRGAGQSAGHRCPHSAGARARWEPERLAAPRGGRRPPASRIFSATPTRSASGSPSQALTSPDAAGGRGWRHRRRGAGGLCPQPGGPSSDAGAGPAASSRLLALLSLWWVLLSDIAMGSHFRDKKTLSCEAEVETAASGHIYRESGGRESQCQ